MKNLLFFSLVLLPFVGISQVRDSAAVARKVDSLIQVSEGLTEKRDFEKALEVNALAEKLVLEWSGKESEAYANTCFNQGRIFHLSSQYPEAEKWYSISKDIRAKVSGKDNLDFAKILNNLALIKSGQGDYENAETLLLDVKYIQEKRIGKSKVKYAETLINLANVYWKASIYEKAEPLYIESKTIFENKNNTKNPSYAKCLRNLASLYRDMGNYEKSEILHLKSMAISELVFGKESEDYASGLNSLAILYDDLGDYEKSLLLYTDALKIRQDILGIRNPSYAGTLVNLAKLNREFKNYIIAEQLLIEAKALLEAGSENHPFYTICISQLAQLYQEMGNDNKAIPFFLESLKNRESKKLEQNPDYPANLNNLATSYLKLGKYTSAEPLMIKACEIEMNLILKASRYFSEHEMLAYSNKYLEGRDRSYSLPKAIATSPEFVANTYHNALFHKAFLLHSTTHIRQRIARDSALTEQYNLYKSCHRRLAKEYEKPIAGRQGVEELEEKANALEKELARSVAGFGEAQRQVTWQEVQARLKPDEAAVEFVHFRYYTPDPTDSVLYAALVLRPGWEQPRWVYLCEERQLQGLLPGDYDQQPQEAVNRLYTHRLYELVWQPLDSLLAGVSKVYYSPSGLLHRINLPAIPASDSIRLMDAYQMEYVGSTRGLVTGKAAGDVAMNSAVIYGGLKYSLDTTEIPLAYAGSGRGAGAFFSSGTSLVPRDSVLRSWYWKDLPQSEVERARLERLFKANGMFTMTLRGYEGTEESFKDIGERYPSPRVLHLATHGYFFPDPKVDKSRLGEVLTGGQSNYRFADNPLLRSGLILAGGNRAWTAGEALPGREDGILSAYEISRMNLASTELVVLSACQTGLGDIEGSEGVFGLQRAFKMAGARYIVMTLWSIPDSPETVDFMDTFYTHLLSGMPVRDAFYRTQKEMRERNPDPFFWAGFVLVE